MSSLKQTYMYQKTDLDDLDITDLRDEYEKVMLKRANGKFSNRHWITSKLLKETSESIQTRAAEAMKLKQQVYVDDEDDSGIGRLHLRSTNMMGLVNGVNGSLATLQDIINLVVTPSGVSSETLRDTVYKLLMLLIRRHPTELMIQHAKDVLGKEWESWSHCCNYISRFDNHARANKKIPELPRRLIDATTYGAILQNLGDGSDLEMFLSAFFGTLHLDGPKAKDVQTRIAHQEKTRRLLDLYDKAKAANAENEKSNSNNAGSKKESKVRKPLSKTLMVTYTTEGGYKCSLCKFITKSKSHITTHLNKAHPEKEPTEMALKKAEDDLIDHAHGLTKEPSGVVRLTIKTGDLYYTKLSQGDRYARNDLRQILDYRDNVIAR